MTQPAGPPVILLIDDDHDLRNVLAIILRRAGHAVVEAASGMEALALAVGRHIDVVVSDVVMPGLSGPQTVARLNQDRAPVPTLFISGYDRSETARHGVPVDGVAFLQKPISAAALTASVAALLGGPAPPSGRS